jgi:hypothetical protein
VQIYKNKQDLIQEIDKTYELLYKEFEDINNKDIHKEIAGVEKTPYQVLAYNIGWLNHLMQWDKDEMLGKLVVTPAVGIKWNEVGRLYQQFYDDYSNDNLHTLLQRFNNAELELIAWIDKLDDETLFELNKRKWAYNKAGWPVYKWIHINSVAPFKSGRAMIRKWKKLNNE